MRTRTIAISLAIALVIALFSMFIFETFLATKTAAPARNITDFETPYNADAEIAKALEDLKKNPAKAAVITGFRSGPRQIALTFDGLTDRATMQKILDLLKKYNTKATFFVDGLSTAEDPQIVVNIKKEGQRVENYTLLGLPKMEALPVERLVKDFCRAAKIIKINTDQGPNILKCNQTQYTDQVLQAAKASGFSSVVKSDFYFDAKKNNTVAKAEAFVRTIRPGSIVSVKLHPSNEPILNEAGKTDLRPAIDKQPGLKELPKDEPGEKELVEAVEKLLISLQKAKYATVYVEDFPKNNNKKAMLMDNTGRPSVLAATASFIREQIAFLFSIRTAYAAETDKQKAQEITVIHTTEQAVAYTFTGLAKEAVVNDVLARLKRLGIKATFFVTELEMARYPWTVRKIIGDGHEIGIAIRPKDGATFTETTGAITRAQSLLQQRFKISATLVKQLSGPVSETTKEAVGALDLDLIGQSMNVVLTRHKEYTNAEAVLAEIFGKNVLSASRGQILYFRMDFYTNDRLVGDLVELIKKRKVDNIAYQTSFDNPAGNPENDSQYKILPVGRMLNNTKLVYEYPLDLKNVPVRLRTIGPSPAIDGGDFLAEAAKRYIGQKDVNHDDRMIGFSKMEERRLDQTGYIHTDEKVIFLTFDDFGSDAAINKLLYVLRKHNVPATFFILTNNVLHNPNLLRAIAVEGHNIGSHSDEHRPMVVADPKTGRLIKTADREEYKKDVALAYQKLRDVVGDVIVNGKPALTRFFRPPQLALSKDGLEALFDSGYEYIISGSTSTRDYEAKNITELVERIKDGLYTEDGELQKGAILVMHMSDTSIYTAMALDILLTANEAKADSDPTKFRVGRLPDFIPEGYSQIDRKKSLRLNSRDKTED